MPIRRRPRHRSSGFTLIEAMVAVVIIGILAAIAYPYYLDQVRKARRTVAKTALLEVANRQELKYFSLRNFVGATQLDFPTVSDGAIQVILFDRNGAPTTVREDAVYAVSVQQTDNANCGGPPCFILHAIPKNDQTNDACGTFTIDRRNQKGVSGGSLPASACW